MPSASGIWSIRGGGAGFSLVLLAMAAVCFFPFCKLRSIPFFATLSLIALFPVLVRHLKQKRRARMVLFPFLILAALAIFLFDGNLAAGIVIGIFVSIGVLWHVLILFPQTEGKIRSAVTNPQEE